MPGTSDRNPYCSGLHAGQVVAVLVHLYDHHPDGFLKGSDAARDVRETGRRLDQLGGLQAMLEAHKMFAAERPRMARNLEIIWDGIGTWQG